MDHHMDFKEDYFQSSSGKIFFKHHEGAGQSIIFLHGFGAGSFVWKRLMTVLPDDLDVYLIDLLGHGKSEKPHLAYTVSLQVDVLSQFIRANKLEHAVLFGHSFGGWIASKYVAAGGKAKAIVLEDSAGIAENHDAVKSSGSYDDFKDEMFKRAMEIAGNDEYVIRSSIENSEGELLSPDEFSRITLPTMIIWGKEDNIVPVDYATGISNAIKNSRLEIIEGAEHNPHYSKPDVVTKLLLDFIRSLR